MFSNLPIHMPIAEGNWLPPPSVEITEIRKFLDLGTSLPLTAIAEDSNGDLIPVVLKVREPAGAGNHSGPTSLACELVCCALAELLSLPVPPYFVADISLELALAERRSQVRAVLQRNLGPNFAVSFCEGYSDFDPLLISPRNKGFVSFLEELLSFDATVLNPDRRLEKSNLLVRGDDALLIDHSLALQVFLPILGGSAEDKRQLPISSILGHCAKPTLFGKNRSFEAVPTKWPTAIPKETLTEIRNAIPEKWESSQGNLDAIFAFLEDRVTWLPEMQDRLRRTMQ